MLVADRRAGLGVPGAERTADASLRTRLTQQRRRPLRLPRSRPGTAPDAVSGAQRRSLSGSLWRPGWPLVAIFVLFPLWWVLGLTEWAPLLLAIPMGLYLLKLPSVQVPKGFGWWALFLVWSLAGIAVLNVPAVGAVADASGTRIVTYLYRLAWYAAVTIACLYVLNTREKLSTMWIVRVVSVLFVVVVAGGLLGLLVPAFEFTSAMELILPEQISQVPFVNHMIHPSAAQLQDVLGYEAPRPSAPFSYTNTWGVHLAVLAPFFALGWLGKGARWRRALMPVVAILALVAVIYSINRGLWVALAVGVGFLAVRAAFLGRPALLVATLVAAVLAVGGIAFTSLGTVVQDRIAAEGSVEGRTNLSTLTVRSVTLTSPLVGLGSTRNVQGNFNTIAGGATAECPRCSPPALGTQGQIWLVVFSQGLVGLILFLGFFVSVFLRNVRRRDPTATMGLAVLVLSAVTMFVYNSLGTALLVVMIAVGLMARGQDDPARTPPRPGRITDRYAGPAPTLGGYWRLVRSNVAVISALALAGAGVGLAWQAVQGTPVRATVSVLVPDDRVRSPIDTSGPLNIDTEAQLLAAPGVQEALTSATSPLGPREERSTQILATPNSRVLHISYTADHEADAVAGARAAADAFMVERARQYAAQRTAQVDALTARAASLDRDIVTQTTALRAVVGLDGLKVPADQTLTIKATLETTTAEVNQVRSDIVRLTIASLPQSSITAVSPPRPRLHVWIVSGLGGLFTGLLAGLLLAAYRDRGGGRVGSPSQPWRANGIPLLASAPPAEEAPARGPSRRDLVARVLALFDADRALPVDPDSSPQRSAVPAPATGPQLAPGRRAVLLVERRTAYRDLNRAAQDVVHRGGEVRGAVHVG